MRSQDMMQRTYDETRLGSEGASRRSSDARVERDVRAVPRAENDDAGHTGVLVRATDEPSRDPARDDEGGEITRVVPVKLIEALREASRASDARPDLRARDPRLAAATDDAMTTDSPARVPFEPAD